MATKSFQTQFEFKQKSADALANALNKSKRVDIKITQPVNRFTAANKEKVHRAFDLLFLKDNNA